MSLLSIYSYVIFWAVLAAWYGIMPKKLLKKRSAVDDDQSTFF